MIKNIHESRQSVPPDIWLFHADDDYVGNLLSTHQTPTDVILQRLVSEAYGAKAEVLREEGGKPYVRTTGEKIHVSLAHSKGIYVAVCSKSHLIGVDVEWRYRKVPQTLASRMRHSSELESDLEKLTPLHIWTAKEAVLKAMGTGLRYPMRNLQLYYSEQSWRIAANSALFDVYFLEDKPAIITLAVGV